MKEACIGGDQTFIADDQAAEVAQPREGALDDPPSPVAAIRRAGRLRGRPGVPGRPTATVSSVLSRRVPSAGEAASRDAPNGGPAPSPRTIHLVPWPRLVLPTLAPLVSQA